MCALQPDCRIHGAAAVAAAHDGLAAAGAVGTPPVGGMSPLTPQRHRILLREIRGWASFGWMLLGAWASTHDHGVWAAIAWASVVYNGMSALHEIVNTLEIRE
jgi:hypothetical protein